jgi:CheY-like chemotaxis protein
MANIKQKTKVLIADDSRDAADALVKLVSKMGYEAKAVYSGSGVLKAADFQPDFIFMDIDLGDTDGYEIAKNLKKNSKFSGSKLIALTGYSQTEAKTKAKEAGFHYHLAKPVGLADLDKILKRATD